MTVERDDIVVKAPGGVELAGHLRRPDTAGPAPAIVFTGPFTGVKEQVTGLYAAALAQRGFVTLAFDHRGFGASSGEPRQHEAAAGKGLDLLAATSALVEHPAVDRERIGAVGICLGGSYAVRHTAFDPRIKALGLVAGGYNDPVAFHAGMGDGYHEMLGELADVATREMRTGVVEYMSAVDSAGGDAAMGGDEPFQYYGNERSASPGWVNRVTRLSIRELLTLDAVSSGPLIAPRPTLMIHGRVDAFCTPENAVAMFERIDEPKRIVWLDTTNHIDLYDNPVFVEPAVDHLVAWFSEHLRRQGRRVVGRRGEV